MVQWQRFGDIIVKHNTVMIMSLVVRAGMGLGWGGSSWRGVEGSSAVHNGRASAYVLHNKSLERAGG